MHNFDEGMEQKAVSFWFCFRNARFEIEAISGTHLAMTGGDFSEIPMPGSGDGCETLQINSCHAYISPKDTACP